MLKVIFNFGSNGIGCVNLSGQPALLLLHDHPQWPAHPLGLKFLPRYRGLPRPCRTWPADGGRTSQRDAQKSGHGALHLPRAGSCLRDHTGEDRARCSRDRAAGSHPALRWRHLDGRYLEGRLTGGDHQFGGAAGKPRTNGPRRDMVQPISELPQVGTLAPKHRFGLPAQAPGKSLFGHRVRQVV